MLFVGLGVLAISMVAFFRVPLLPYIGRDLDLSTADLGLITTVFALGRLAADIPAGRLADRRPAVWMLAVAALILALGSLLLAGARHGPTAILAALVLGIASSVANTTGMTYFSTTAPTARRGSAMALFSAALLGGQALGPMLGGVLADLGTWRTAQVAAALLAVAIAALMRFGTRGQTSARASAARGSERASDPQGPGVPVVERMILYAVPFVMFFTLGAMPQTLVPIIGADELGLTAAVIGVALGLGGLCRFVGALVGGAVSDRVSRKAALVPGLALQSGGVALLALDGGLWPWVAAIVVMSLASFGIAVAATMLADHSRGRRIGRQLGPFRFVGDLGLIAGPVTGALIFEHLGRRPAVLTVAGLLGLCAVAAALVLRETRWLSDEVGVAST